MTTACAIMMMLTAAAVGSLLYRERLSANMMVILIFLYFVGNTELLLTYVGGGLPESLPFITTDDLEYATFLFNWGLLAIAAGMWTMKKLMPAKNALTPAPPSALPLSLLCTGRTAVKVYGVLFVGASVLKVLIAGPLSSIAQLLLPLLLLRFFPLFVLAYRYFTERREGMTLLALAIFEVLANLSFFASFKDLFVVMLAAALLALHDGARFRFGPTLIAAALMLLTAGTWSYVKGDFRSYISGGERAQIDTRGIVDKLDFLQRQIGSMGVAQLGQGLSEMVLRIAYNGFFAATTRHVPDHLDHTGGAHLKGAIAAAVTPRFLFPDKPVIDDSEIVRFYTGIPVAGAESGTSINIGQFGELYADLGILGMLIGLFVYGLVLGALEAMIRRLLPAALDAHAWTAIFVVTTGILILSLPKLIAGYAYLAISIFVLLRYALPAVMRQLQRTFTVVVRGRSWR